MQVILTELEYGTLKRQAEANALKKPEFVKLVTDFYARSFRRELSGKMRDWLGASFMHRSPEDAIDSLRTIIEGCENRALEDCAKAVDNHQF